jgi:hypothetical protein
LYGAGDEASQDKEIAMKTYFTDAQEIRDRWSPGIDHGCDGKILVRIGTGTNATRLMWEGGNTYWASRGTQGYSESELSVTTKGKYDDRFPNSTTLHKGGRLSKKLIRTHRDKLMELLNLPAEVIAQIDPKRTLVIEREPDSPVLREMRTSKRLLDTYLRLRKSKGREEDAQVALDTLKSQIEATIYQADAGLLLTDAEIEAKLEGAVTDDTTIAL